MTRYATETEAESYEAADLARIALQAAVEAVEKWQDRNGVCDAPFRCTLHMDNGVDAEISPVEYSGSAVSLSEALDRSIPDGVLKHDDGWISHDGGECPVHPMDIVHPCDAKGRYSLAAQRPAWDVNWSGVGKYQIIRDSDGVPYCSAEGLPKWANYVATDGADDMAYAYEFRPSERGSAWHIDDDREGVRPDRWAPTRFTNTQDPWTQTLRRVYRREDA